MQSFPSQMFAGVLNTLTVFIVTLTVIFSIRRWLQNNLVVRKKWPNQIILTAFMMCVSKMIIPLDIVLCYLGASQIFRNCTKYKNNQKKKHATRILIKVDKANSLLFSCLFMIIFKQTFYLINQQLPCVLRRYFYFTMEILWNKGLCNYYTISVGGL